MTKKKPLKVGFDLDGVLLYNPARVVRKPIKIIKRVFFPDRVKKFYFPSSKLEKFLWRLFHLSSIFIAPGLSDIEKLQKKGLIEPYIVTARYSFLEKDSQFWFKILNKKKIFKAIYLNKKNEQPHIYKEKMIKTLQLDIFIEDNVDIVQHLIDHVDTDVFWIHNLMDKFIDYPHKYSSLKKSLEKISKRFNDE